MLHNYLISSGNSTYNGYTVDPLRRLRQHNNQIVGGARRTTTFVKKGGDPWEYVMIISCSTWTISEAMEVEWNIRYPTRKKKRPSIYNGVKGRLDGALHVLSQLTNKTEDMYFVHVKEKYLEYVKSLVQQLQNVQVSPLDECSFLRETAS